jgi:dihydrofolate reductase
MSRLIMWNLMTLNGAFEGAAKWDLSWFDLIRGDEFYRFGIEQLRSSDRLLFGRVTYEGMAAYWRSASGEDADFMNGLPKYVFTRSASVTPWNNTTIVREDAIGAVRKLKTEGSRYTFVFGSGNFSKSLIEHDLFDEYRLLLVPTIVTGCTPLFADLSSRHDLKLLEAQPLSSGGIILRYEPVRTA